jgi:glutamate:Na+ symporter, ESS family
MLGAMPTYTVAAIGASLIVLSVVFAVAAFIRSKVGILRDLFLPVSVIGGFLALVIGPQIMGELTGGRSLVSAEVAAIWSRFPSLLINVIFAALMLGKTLPSIRGLWTASSGHVMLGYGLSFGQYAFGSLLAVTILIPVLGLAPESAALLEIAFTGGHGTAAGLSGTFEDLGVGYMTDLALGLATIGLVAGIIVGSLLVRWAIASPRFSIAREEQLSRADDRDPGRLAAYDREATPAVTTPATPATPPAAHDRGIAPLTITVIAIGLSILVGWAILEGLRAIERALTGETAIMGLMPLFPMTIIGGMLVQFAATKAGIASMIDRSSVNQVSGLSLDVLILTAVGTMSLAALSANLGALALMSATAIAWSVASVVLLAHRLFRERWFENSMGDFGQSMGTIATGFMLMDMADPKHVTGATTSFGYKQLLFEPFVGGGLITAMAVPFIHSFGAGAMLIVSTIATVAVFAIGFRLARAKPTPGGG